jgi:hypothetical protein
MFKNSFSRLYSHFFPENSDTYKESTNETKSKIYVLTIQILFGIIIGISFTDYHKELVPFRYNFETIMIFVAYSTVLLSLIGYSITIHYRYHRNFLRFSLDIFLLYLYYQLVYSPQNSFDYFLSIFPIIFGIYVIWQCLEYLEWRKKDYPKKEFRKIVLGTIVFFAIFLAISLLYDGSLIQTNAPNQILNYWPITDNEKIVLGSIIVLLFLFRIFIAKISSKPKFA